MQAKRRDFLAGCAASVVASRFGAGIARAAERVPVLGLIFPPFGRGIPEEGVAMYGDQLKFVVNGLGLDRMTPDGYDSVIDKIPAAAEQLAAAGEAGRAGAVPTGWHWMGCRLGHSYGCGWCPTGHLYHWSRIDDRTCHRSRDQGYRKSGDIREYGRQYGRQRWAHHPGQDGDRTGWGRDLCYGAERGLRPQNETRGARLSRLSDLPP